MPAADPLSQLRDIQPPGPAPWWPPAPGWWVLAALVLALLTAALWWWRRDARRRRLRREALAALAAVDGRAEDGAALAAGVNQVLRRVALALFPREQVAALRGDAWLRFLAETGGRGAIPEGPARALTEGAYDPSRDVPREALLDLAQDWVRRVTRVGTRGRRRSAP